MTRFHATAAPPAPIDLNPRTDTPLDFPFREFGEMTPQDYAEIGFMCGLEVHQQILTKSKLFCRCPAGLRQRRVDAEILRHMRPTLSELGKYDGTALMEFKTRKEIVYQLDRRCTCTYELDDTPPFPIDPEAVKIALEIARLHDMALVSELQVMRKQYLDGSIPTGFQRSAVIAVGGVIPFPHSELGRDSVIKLRQLTLEEDSCREVSDVGHRITFKTDRLGMPLTETVTDPDLLTPNDVEAAGRLLASISRASGKVRRGIGAARQDVNVSIAGSRRVELKGVAHHRGLPRLVHVEAFRHLELLKIRAELEKREVTDDLLPLPGPEPAWESPLVVDARADLRRCDYAPIRSAIQRGDFVAAVRLPRFRGLLNWRTQPDMTFAHEFADRVKVIACLVDRPFLIGSHIRDYGLKASEWKRLKRAVRADNDDEVFVVWGPEEDVDTAAREILIRARDALVGVPSETRQTWLDGTNGLERILPGPERMYPDTDTPGMPIPDEWVDTVEANLAERPWERSSRYVQMGLTEPSAERLAVAPWADLFDQLAPSTPTAARRLAAALEKRLVHHWRRTGHRDMPDAVRIGPLVRAVEAGELRPEAFERVFDALLGTAHDAAQIVAEHAPRPDDERLLADAINLAKETVAAETEAGRFHRRGATPERLLGRALGLVMPRFLGRLDARHVHHAVASAFPNGNGGDA